MTSLIEDLVPDELWALVEPLLPARRAHPTATGAVGFQTATASPELRAGGQVDLSTELDHGAVVVVLDGDAELHHCAWSTR